MTVAPIASGVAGSPPPEPDLTPADAVARAETIAATLVARQAETEERTFYAADTHEAIAAAGLYRILTPRRYGGYEFGIDTFLRVATALARGCPSSAWMYVFAHAHALPVATLFGERAQDEVFADGDFRCPATVAPGGSAERVDGGWRISGSFPYCSGSPYATHFMGHTLIPTGADQPPAPLLFLVPAADFRRLDDWGGQLGLKGSGSHTLVLDDAFVPDHRTIHGHFSQLAIDETTPGHLLHANPQYAGGQLGFMLFELGALAVGMAKGALDEYADLMRSRTTSFFPIVSRTEDPDFQFKFGEASGMVAAAEAALGNAADQWNALARQGPTAFTRAEEVRLAMISREAVRLCWRAVEGQLFPTAGSSSVRHGQRIERVWRDLSTLHSHAGVGTFLATIANREYAKAVFEGDRTDG